MNTHSFILCGQVRSSAGSRVPHPLLHLPPQPSLPGPAALLLRQRLRGAGLLPDDPGEAPAASRLLDHPRSHRGRPPPQQGIHCDPQPSSQAEVGLQAALHLRGSHPEPGRGGTASRAVQQPGRQGVSGSAGLLHDGDGADTSGDAAPRPRREGPGAAAGGHSHRVDTEDPAQTYRLPRATAERHGEITRRKCFSPQPHSYTFSCSVVAQNISRSAKKHVFTDFRLMS